MKIKTLRISSIILAFVFTLSLSRVNGAGVFEVTTDEMLLACQLVFEGRVTSVESRLTGTRRIHTFVTCEIQEIIKGDYTEDTIILRFLGGSVGNQTLAVSDMTIPRAGEHGIYFVESLERDQVHPLYGWSQGHFIIEDDGAVTNRVMTGQRHPVTALTFDSESEETDILDQTEVKELSTGVAQGVKFEQNKKGLTSDEFKQALKERLHEIVQ